MNDIKKTKQHLLAELGALRAQVEQVQEWKAKYEFQQAEEIRRATETLRLNKARYAQAATVGKVGVWEWDLKTNRIYFDSYLQSVIGLSEEEMHAHPRGWNVCMHPDDIPRVEAVQKAYFAGEIPRYETEHRLVHKDGSIRWFLCRATAVRDVDGAPLRLLGTDTDITERKAIEEALRKAHAELERRVQERTIELERANEALRESEERYRGIFENANDIIATFTLDGVITSINRAAEITLGWSKNELIGQNYRRFVTPVSVAIAEERTRQFFLGIKPQSNMEIEVYRKDGGIVLFECRTRPIRDQNGVPVGFQIVYRDITARKQEEEELRQAKEAAEAANQEKSEFLSIMSHELRTPLHVMLGYADLLLTEAYGALEEQQSKVLRKIDKSARDLLDLINGVLDFNRLEAGRMPVELIEVNVVRLLREVEEETQGLREFSGLDFSWQMENNLPALKTDADKLKVVVKNLLQNAIKFTKTGGVTITASPRENGVMISIADTGIGIPLQWQGLIFEAFQKAEKESSEYYDGFGLGLHIVKRLLTLLGGTITVESEVGRGSTFRVWLPVEKCLERTQTPGLFLTSAQ
ncbi:MAG: PAS domain S-box protein [Deltaproteobacteria bacterium]|nr:PAS domain S-box protein [Deltaproteobacteria bacterium]